MQEMPNVGSVDKVEIVKALRSGMEELQQNMDAHCGLVTSMLEQILGGEEPRLLLMPPGVRSREAKLEKAILEAIDVIEQSRKAFKSKRLELLRKDLTSVLVEGGREQNRNLE